jgi:hypothetical protein
MATCCELYAHDNDHQYAPNLNLLVPTYMRAIVECPSAENTSSYIDGYSAASKPDIYTLSCHGNLHGDLGLPDNFPRYTPDLGMREQ